MMTPVRFTSWFQKATASTLTAPLAVLAVGLLASTLATLHVQRLVEEKHRESLKYLTLEAEDTIQARLATYLAMLRAGAGLIASQQKTVEREEFRLFVDQLQTANQYPGIQGIGFSARLPGQIDAALREIEERYMVQDFSIYPPGDREEIHSIIHLEPMDRRNRAAIGYDMFSDSIRREAMVRARDSGLPAASGRVQLVQEIDEQAAQAGFLIYMPVYRSGGVPETVEERRRTLLGFVYSPFRADDLMHGIFGFTERPPIDFEIFDGAIHPNNLLHRSFETDPDPELYADTRPIELAGRTWTIRYWSRPGFRSSAQNEFVSLIVFGGLIATIVVTLLSWSQARARRRADQAAAAQRRNAHKLEVLHEIAGRLSAQLDSERLVQQITDTGRELTGAEIGAFFYNVTEEQADDDHYTLSGAPREVFASLGNPRKTALLRLTFEGQDVVRSDDITSDARFGQSAPNKGFPPGSWPVRSYLAVPVMSRTGELHGGLLFGHSQIGVFDEQAEHSVVALAGHAGIAIDNARLFKASQDEITARKRIEEHQKLLLDELNHRVKNTLATVQSIAAQTIRSSPDLRGFRQSFEARLIALSQAHNLLSLSNWRGVELSELVRRELIPHGVDDPNRIAISGERVMLPPAVAVAIGMALHELATNAARHGALSSTTGRVEISWIVSARSDASVLRMEWQEHGGPPVQQPKRRGFGSRMIEQGLKHDLRGEAKLYFESAGVRCVIEAVLPARRAAA
jgi:CHASE1-domain containing sensor protein/two-component sensor histidine kinase